MNLSEWLHGILTKGGLDAETLKLTLADPGLTKIDVPASLEQLVEHDFKDLLTLEAAKQHPDLKKHFIATSMHGVEKDIAMYAKENEFSDEELSELNKIPGAQKRLGAFIKLIKDKSDKKGPIPDNDKIKKLTDQIAQLNAEAIKRAEDYESEKKTLRQGFLDKRKEHAFKELFQSYEYTDALPKDVQEMTARAMFEKQLLQDNNKVVFNEENDSLRLSTNEDTEVYHNNKAISLKQYAERVLAEKKLLKVNQAPSANGDGKKKEPTLVFQPQNGAGKLDNSAFNESIKAAMQDIGSPS